MIKLNKKISASLAAVGLATLVGFGGMPSAHADEPDIHFETATFHPYATSTSWYKTGGTKDNIWPQDRNVITCGGIRQDDDYYIKTREMEDHYKALLASGSLLSPAQDAEFSPRGIVIELPDCAPPVVKPEKPAAIVTTTESRGPVNCDTQNYPITTTTVTTDWTYDETSNTWVKSEPVTTTDVNYGKATVEECPLPVVKSEQPLPIITDTWNFASSYDCGVTPYPVSWTITTVNWTYDEPSNTWVKAAPVSYTRTVDDTVYIHSDEYANAKAVDCPVIAPQQPSTAPVAAISSTVKDVPATVSAARPAAKDATLAYTGSNTVPLIILAITLFVLAGFLFIINRYVKKMK